MVDLLLPTTDADADLQIVVAAVLGTLAIVAVRRNRDARLFAVGLTVLVVAVMAVRAVH